MTSRPAYPVAAVDNTLRVLILLIERQEVRGVDVARHLGVARSTAHRLLAMLVERGFAVQDRRKCYRPGPVLRRLGGVPPGRTGDFVAKVRPVLSSLSRATGETVHLMLLEGNSVRFIDCVEGTQILRVGSRIGMLLPAHATSGGKALLAEMPEDALRALYPRGLPRTDPGSISDYGELNRDLALVRRRGYAVNDSESDPGITAVGACVRDGSGRAVAAIAVAAPETRYPRRRLNQLADHLLGAVQELRAVLAQTGTGDEA